jgi:hypothetical protein
MVAGDAYFGFEAFGFHGGAAPDFMGETMRLRTMALANM